MHLPITHYRCRYSFKSEFLLIHCFVLVAGNKNLHHVEIPERDLPSEDCGMHLRRQLASMCARHTLARRLPISQWLRCYTWSLFLHDLMAGLTVGMTAIPQGIAYAVVAGLEPQVT